MFKEKTGLFHGRLQNGITFDLLVFMSTERMHDLYFLVLGNL